MAIISKEEHWKDHLKWYEENTANTLVVIEGVMAIKSEDVCQYCGRQDVYRNECRTLCIYCSNGYYKDFINAKTKS